MNKNTFIILFIIISFVSLSINAQQQQKFPTAETISMTIPDNIIVTTTDIATYINTHAHSDVDKLKWLYTWITKNITYDVKYSSNNQNPTYKSTDEIVEKAFKNRSGVCLHYAHLFSDIANKMNIKTYVINGYTKQDKENIDKESHAWCCAYVDGAWALFDPTWDAGYIVQNKFVRRPTDKYFMTNPQEFIQTHMPFDPMWQLLNYPLTNYDFMNIERVNAEKIYFNYNDSINKYQQADELTQLVALNARIESVGLLNDFIKKEYNNNQYNINVHYFNSASNSYNKAIEQLNYFILYRNNQFKPEKEESQVRAFIDSIEYYFDQSKTYLKNIIHPNATLNKNITQLYGATKEANKALQEQKEFVDKYYSTKKPFRKTLFNKYTWMGIPLN